MNSLRLSFLYLKRHLFTTLITVIALALAIAGVTVLLKLEILSHSRFNTLAPQGDAIVGAKSGGLDLLLGCLNFEGGVPAYVPQNLYETLKAKVAIQFEDKASFQDSFVIEHITPFLFFGKYKGATLIGTEDSFLTMKNSGTAPRLQDGSFPGPNEAMIGAAIATKENLKIGDYISVHSQIYDSNEATQPMPLKIVGLLKPTAKIWDEGIYTNLITAQTAVARTPGFESIWKSNILSYFLLDIKSGGEHSLSSLINQRTVSQLAFTNKEKAKLEELTGTNQNLQFLVVGALLVLSTLTVLAVFFTRIESRAMELAVLRALGYARRELTALLFIEGMMMGMSSIVLAAILEFILSPIVLMTAGSTLPATNSGNWPSWMILVTGVLALIAIAIASLPPLWKLYRQDVHSALRNIG